MRDDPRERWNESDKVELGGLLEFRGRSGPVSFSSQGLCTPLELSLLRGARSLGHARHLHACFLVNYPLVTLVATQFPDEDPERAGRLRDNLVKLAEAVEHRLRSLEQEQQQLRHAHDVIRAVSELAGILGEIERMQVEQRDAARAIYLDLQQGMEQTFVVLGLTEAQEEVLLGLAKEVHTRFENLQGRGDSVGIRLRTVIGQMRKLVATVIAAE